MHMYGGFLDFFPIFSLLFALAPLIFTIYILLQFLKTNRERNRLLHEILEELRKKQVDK